MIYVFPKFIFIAAQIKYVLLKISSLSFLDNIELSNSEADPGPGSWMGITYVHIILVRGVWVSLYSMTLAADVCAHLSVWAEQY